MAIRVYLSSEVREAPDFEAGVRSPGTGLSEEYHLSHIRLRRDYDTGRFYVELSPIDPVPSLESVMKVLGDFVGEISLREYFYFKTFPGRARGVYTYKDAVGVVDLPGEAYWVEIHGKTVENVVRLYQLIRAGKILPVESWEVEQIHPSRIRSIWEKVFGVFKTKKANAL